MGSTDQAQPTMNNLAEVFLLLKMPSFHYQLQTSRLQTHSHILPGARVDVVAVKLPRWCWVLVLVSRCSGGRPQGATSALPLLAGSAAAVTVESGDGEMEYRI